LALDIRFAATAFKYFETLDKPTKTRIREKLEAIAANPYDPRLSKPLVGVSKRSARVGDYRVIFEIDKPLLIVADLGPRGQIYRRLKR
jgi:mRNA interferase RelE/StbE